MQRLLIGFICLLLPTLAFALANPAAENCRKQGLGYILDKNNIGYCVLPDGSQCEEWAYLRHECTGKKSAADEDVDTDHNDDDNPIPDDSNDTDHAVPPENNSTY